MNKLDIIIKDFEDRIDFLNKEIEEGVTLARQLELQIRIEEIELCLEKTLAVKNKDLQEDLIGLTQPIARKLSSSSSDNSKLSNSSRRFYNGAKDDIIHYVNRSSSDFK